MIIYEDSYKTTIFNCILMYIYEIHIRVKIDKCLHIDHANVTSTHIKK